jgi:hypothetical protein
MTFSDDALDHLAPVLPWQADWTDVLRRAGQPQANRLARPRRVLRKRRLIIAVVVLVAISIPLAALGAANDWWFLRNSGAPRPLSEPLVLKEAEWGGHTWQMSAYPSGTDGLCVAVTRKDLKDVGAMGCSPFVGSLRTAATKATPDMTITYLSGSDIDTGGRPLYIVGPVIDKASEVEIRFISGQTIRVPTFSAPAPLDHIRFYATGLSGGVISPGPQSTPASLAPKWLAGLDKEGNVVACLVPTKAKDGISPLADCR